MLTTPPPSPVSTVQKQGRITVHLLHRHGNTDLTVVTDNLCWSPWQSAAGAVLCRGGMGLRGGCWVVTQSCSFSVVSSQNRLSCDQQRAPKMNDSESEITD
ncbi:hypothetical protein PAMP_005373 [Pampus punctatissimus]